MSFNTIYNSSNPWQLQSALREWLPAFQNPFALTLTYSDDGMKGAQKEASRRVGNIKHEKWIASLTSQLGIFLHRLNYSIYKSAYKRYRKRIGCIPILEGSPTHRYHFHLLINTPKHISDYDLEHLVWINWQYGEVHIQKDTEGLWNRYITKLRTKDFNLESFTDSVIIEHLYF